MQNDNLKFKMPVDRDKIVSFCANYLEASKWHDYCHNGLQIEGRAKVDKIITGVSLSQALIKEAIKKRAGMIMVHHGIFNSQMPMPPRVIGVLRQRLKIILENDINLCGFHLPLDAHPVIGNNISLLKAFKLKKTNVIGSRDYGDIGFIGEYAKPLDLSSFVAMVESTLKTKTFVIAAGNNKVKRIGIVSGGAEDDFMAAADLGADTYLCGQVKESIVRAVEETGINFINAGHYNTEKMGIKNLGELVAKKFKVEVEFVDVPNEV